MTAAGGALHAAYDPLSLDDTELRAGRHRTVMSLPGFTITAVPYVNVCVPRRNARPLPLLLAASPPVCAASSCGARSTTSSDGSTRGSAAASR